jgi:hypothetical protein
LFSSAVDTEASSSLPTDVSWSRNIMRMMPPGGHRHLSWKVIHLIA